MVRRSRRAHAAVMESNAPPAAPQPPPPPPPPLPPHAHRALRRDRAHGMLGGVAAGIARTYGFDVTLVRVLWVVAAVTGIGVPAYVIAWIAIPPSHAPRESGTRVRDPWMVTGLVLLGIGVAVAGDHLLPHGLRLNHFGWPLLLIGGGIAILVLRRRDDSDTRGDGPPGETTWSASADRAAAPAPPAGDDHSQGAPAPGDAHATGPETATETGATATATAWDAEPPTEPGPAVPPVPPTAWTQTAPWPGTVPPSARALRRAARDGARSRRRRPFLPPLTLSVLMIGAGVASLLQVTGAVDVNVTVALAIATGVVGAALVCSAFVGRAHTLIFVGLVLAAATAVSSTLDVPLRGGIGHREYTPASTAEVRSRYELAIGELDLDLRDVRVGNGVLRVEGRVGIGQLLVYVPSNVRVEVDGHAGAGSVMLFGHDSGGWPEDDSRTVNGTGSGVLRLDLRVGAGQVRVRQFGPLGYETIIGGN